MSSSFFFGGCDNRARAAVTVERLFDGASVEALRRKRSYEAFRLASIGSIGSSGSAGLDGGKRGAGAGPMRAGASWDRDFPNAQ
jgi:hypothetical protein